MIRNLEMENFFGQMEELMKVIGKMVNNMEKVSIIQQMDKRKREYGKMEKEYAGFD
jgi:hypothetical protein